VFGALGLSLAGCADGALAAEEGVTVNGNQITVDLTVADGLARAGGFLLISQANTMAVNVDGTTIRAFTSVCTHQGCTINRFSNNLFRCPCHGSQYSTTGGVVTGPATRPLQEYQVERNGDLVTITK